jgi:hypothetical protein
MTWAFIDRLEHTEGAGQLAKGLAALAVRRLAGPGAWLAAAIAAQRKAFVAEELTRTLCAMSAADLARLGIERHQIAQFVQERLFAK